MPSLKLGGLGSRLFCDSDDDIDLNTGSAQGCLFAEHSRTGPVHLGGWNRVPFCTPLSSWCCSRTGSWQSFIQSACGGLDHRSPNYYQ